MGIARIPSSLIPQIFYLRILRIPAFLFLHTSSFVKLMILYSLSYDFLCPTDSVPFISLITFHLSRGYPHFNPVYFSLLTSRIILLYLPISHLFKSSGLLPFISLITEFPPVFSRIPATFLLQIPSGTLFKIPQVNEFKVFVCYVWVLAYYILYFQYGSSYNKYYSELSSQTILKHT